MFSSLAAELGIETIETVGPPKKSRSTQLEARLEDNFCPSPSKSSEESVSNESDDDEADVEFIGYIIIESYIQISLVALEFSKSRKPKLLCYNTQFTCTQGYTNTTNTR
jgi:hypothetical protein